jgi:hypothetical protein
METNLIPGGEITDESTGQGQMLIPADPAGILDSDASTPPPAPATRRRPVIVCMGS